MLLLLVCVSPSVKLSKYLIAYCKETADGTLAGYLGGRLPCHRPAHVSVSAGGGCLACAQRQSTSASAA